MNRSALNAEVEHHLRMQELERVRDRVVDVERKQPGLFAGVQAFLTRRREVPRLGLPRGKEREATEQYRERFVG